MGKVDADTFVKLAAELFALLAERDRQDLLTLADHLASADWWDDHLLGYGPVTTIARLEHWASRLKLVSSAAKCLWVSGAWSFSTSAALPVWVRGIYIRSPSCCANCQKSVAGSWFSAPSTGLTRWPSKSRGLSDGSALSSI